MPRMFSFRHICLLLICLLLPGASGVVTDAAQDKQDKGAIVSKRAGADFALTADPNAASWKNVRGVIAGRDNLGEPVPGHRTEIRSRWTDGNLYFLFICPYQQLNLKPNPSATTETNKLWEWDVAEAFIGTDFQDIKHYTEFQVSPQSEWVDLDIDRKPTPAAHDWQWNSGFEVRARLDQERKIWYGEMKIPMAKIDRRAAKQGNEMRINFYRLQGPGPNRAAIAWRQTGSRNNHVPESFGTLRLGK
ncbi:MAG: carbohydrate-binding family 9-like protein [Blastocatellia bacterium]